MKSVDRHVDLSRLTSKRITVWHSNNMYVWIQGSLWGDERRQMQLIPSRILGYVAITSQDVSWGCVPVTRGYILYRPVAVVFGYEPDVDIKIVGISMLQMQEWEATFKPWARLKLPTR